MSNRKLTALYPSSSAFSCRIFPVVIETSHDVRSQKAVTTVCELGQNVYHAKRKCWWRLWQFGKTSFPMFQAEIRNISHLQIKASVKSPEERQPLALAEGGHFREEK